LRRKSNHFRWRS